MNYRKKVVSVYPHAWYMNLSTEERLRHCVDDSINDRYIAYGRSSRYLAWKAAYEFLVEKGIV